MSEFIQSQEKILRRILRKNARTSLYVHLGIHNLYRHDDFEDLYREFKSKTAVFTQSAYTAFLKKLAEEWGLGDVEVLSRKKLISAEEPLAFTHFLNQGLVPVGQEQISGFFKAEKDVFKALEHQLGKLDGKLFYLPESCAIQQIDRYDIASLQVLQNRHRSWWWGKKFGPPVAGLASIGKSRYQHLHACLDLLEEHGKDISVLVCQPHTLTEMALILAQREGGFVPLRALCPGLKALMVNGLGLTLHRKEMEYFLHGYKDLKILEMCNWPGFFACQDDVNIKRWLKVYDQIGTFLEFIPANQMTSDGRLHKTYDKLYAGEVEKDGEYLLVLTTMDGLLSFTTEHIVRVESLDPFRIALRRPVGRLNMFQENLPQDLFETIIGDINQALTGRGVFIRDYIAGDNSDAKRPQWVLEISRAVAEMEETLLKDIVTRLHKGLEEHHPDYRRSFQKALIFPPEVTFVPMGTFAALPDSFERTHFDFTPDCQKVSAVINRAWDKKTMRVLDAL